MRDGGHCAVFGSNGAVGGHSAAITHGETLIIGRKGSFGEVHYSRESCWPIDTTYFVDSSGTGANLRWLYYALRTLRLTDLNRAAAIPGLNRDDAYRQALMLPPLAEQRRIAAILDKADALRQKRREAIAKLDQLLQSIFLEMFGDPVTNPKGWDKVPMGSLIRVRRGGSPRPIDNFLGGDHPWIKIGDATQGDDVYITRTKEKIVSAGLSKTVHLKAGSLVFANCGVSLGFARILKIDGCIHDGWLAFEDIPEKTLGSLFLLKALNGVTRYFRLTAPSGTQPNLNTGIMKNFQIILPPRTLQKHFESIVGATSASRAHFASALDMQNHIFASLQQRAFTGQL